jgi:hypothetical protein
MQSAQRDGARESRARRRQAWTERFTRSVLPIATSRSGRVPRVDEVDPYGIVGVSRPRSGGSGPPPPYVARHADEPLDEALRQRRRVLVIGESKAGASRSAFEAVRRVFPRSKLLVPAGTSRTLATLVRDPPFALGPDPPVLWLDDLDRYLGDATGFDDALLAWLLGNDGRMAVVGTMNLQRCSDLLATRTELTRTHRLLLEHAGRVILPSELSPEERAEAERLYPDEAHGRGLGEELAGAPELEEEYDAGMVLAPVGWALVQAAVDWRRAGMLRAIPEADLRLLCTQYLDQLVGPAPMDKQLDNGLMWACRQMAPLLSVSTRGRQRWLRVARHLVAYADRHPARPMREIPSGAWDLVVARSSPEEAVRVGFTAYVRGTRGAAEAAWSSASASGHPEAALRAADNLRVLRQVGAAAAIRQTAEARLAFLRETSTNLHTPWAMVGYARLLARLGYIARASQAFQHVIVSGTPGASPAAAGDLAKLAVPARAPRRHLNGSDPSTDDS